MRSGSGRVVRPRLYRRMYSTYSTYSAPTWLVIITSSIALRVAERPKSSTSQTSLRDSRAIERRPAAKMPK